MRSITSQTCLVLFCFIVGIFCGNYTYYDGFAYKITNQTTSNQTLNSCVCQCLLTSGCSALTFYNGTRSCSLLSDKNITEDEVTLTTGATLLLVSANIIY